MLEFILAADSLTKAKSIITNHPQIPIVEVNLLIRQAIVFSEMDPVKGLEYHENALNLAIETDLKTLQIAQYFNLTKSISDAFYSIENYPDDVKERLKPWRTRLPDLIENTIRITKKTEYEPYGLAAVGLYFFTVEKNYKKCVSSFREASQIFLDMGNKLWAADSLRNLAECQVQIGETSEADESIETSHKLLKESIQNLSDSDKYNYGLVKSQILFAQRKFRRAYLELDKTFKLKERTNAKAKLSQFSQQSAMMGLAESEKSK